MKWLLALFCFCSIAQAQFGLRSPAYVAQLQRPAAAGGSFVPTDVSDMVFWLDPDTVTASDGDGVATLTDQSGNGYDFSQSVSGSRALFTNSTSFLNNKKSLWFDGTADHYTNLVYTSEASNYSFWFVVKQMEDFGGFANRYLLDATDPGTPSVRATDTATFKVAVYDASATHAFEFLQTEPIILEVILNSTGTAGTVYTNGVQMGASVAWAQPVGGDTLTLCSQNGGTASHFNGALGDVIAYRRALNSTERGNIRSYLATKYGITVP